MRTALMLASAKGHATVVTLLVAAGADKNLQDKVSG
jgi:ankyrin repeat protein